MIAFAIGTGARKRKQLKLKVRLRRNEQRSEGNSYALCKGKRPDNYVWLFPKTGKPFADVKKAFIRACEDAGIEGLVWHDLRATYGTRLGEAGFNAYDIAKLMGHANISTSQRYVRNLPVGAGEAVMLKNQRRHSSTGPTLSDQVRAR